MMVIGKEYHRVLISTHELFVMFSVPRPEGDSDSSGGGVTEQLWWAPGIQPHLCTLESVPRVMFVITAGMYFAF